MVQTCDSEGFFMAGPKMGCRNSKKAELSHHFPRCVCVVVFVSICSQPYLSSL